MVSISDPSRAGRLQARPQPLANAAAGAGEKLTHPVMILLILLSMTQPYSILAGPLLMGPYRLVLLIFAIPLLLGWVRGKYGGFIAADWLLLAHVGWMFVSLLMNGHGIGQVMEYGAAQFIDIYVAYLLGRAAIRSKQDFYFFIKFFLAILVFLAPFAFLESTQGKMILQDLFRGLPNTYTFRPVTLKYPERMGLKRAMTTLNHPILYGVLCSMVVSLGLVGLRYCRGGTSTVKRVAWTSGSLIGVFFSLSAGALVGAMLQLALVFWDRILAVVQARWKILFGIVAVIYVILDIIAARPPLVVMARVVAFSSSTAWNRYMIWQFGSAEVWRNPIFGMGLFTDWQRNRWMPASVDNHWLLIAMRFGLPGIACLLGAYIYLIVKLIKAPLRHDPELDAIRKGFAFTFLALFFSFGTVASWHVTYALLLVMMGGCVWLFNEPQEMAAAPAPSAKELRRSGTPAPDQTAAPAGDIPAEPRSRYTRFPGKPGRRG